LASADRADIFDAIASWDAELGGLSVDFFVWGLPLLIFQRKLLAFRSSHVWIGLWVVRLGLV